MILKAVCDQSETPDAWDILRSRYNQEDTFLSYYRGTTMRNHYDGRFGTARMFNAGADGFGARKGGVSGTILSESACVPSLAKKPVTRSHGVCVSSESPSHQSPTQCSAESRAGKGKDGQRGVRAFSRSRNQKVHRFGARLLFRRLPGPRRTFVVDDARRAVAAVVRALDERDHRVYAQEG